VSFNDLNPSTALKTGSAHPSMNSGRAEIRTAHGELVEPLKRLKRLEHLEPSPRVQRFERSVAIERFELLNKSSDQAFCKHGLNCLDIQADPKKCPDPLLGTVACPLKRRLCAPIAKDSGVKIESQVKSLVHSNVSRIRGRPMSRQVRNPFRRIFPTS